MKNHDITGQLKIGDRVMCYRAPFENSVSVVKSIHGKKAFTGDWYLCTDIYGGKEVFKYRTRYNPYCPGPTFELLSSPPIDTLPHN